MCGMTNGGQCGLDSHDNFLNSLLGSLIFVPTVHRLPGRQASWGFSHVASRLTLLPSHARPFDQPPRPTL
jgi:hypothetical protein